MNWIQLTSLEQLTAIKKDTTTSMIFKHSTRCSISSASLDRLERRWDSYDPAHSIHVYYLDLLNYRDISAAIVDAFGIEHQSPQALVIQGGICTYDASHMDIDVSEMPSIV
jgi:bacillithiol system protein YtxJ